MSEKLIIKIDGNDASNHMFPLLEGGQALSGIGLSLTRTSHYLLTGKVRHKAPYDQHIRFMAAPPRTGSIEFDIANFLYGAAPTTTIGTFTFSITASLAASFGIYIINLVVGRKPKNTNKTISSIAIEKEGDIGALAAAIHSPIKQAHNIIGGGATNINIIGNNNNVSFDGKTKEYVHSSIEADAAEIIDGSVGSMNGNQRTGGIFIYKLRRSIPFDIAKSASQDTIKTLLDSFSNYTLGYKDRSRIEIKALSYSTTDGTVKKYIIVEANDIDPNDPV